MNIQDKLLVWRFNRGDLEAVRLIYEGHKHDLLALATALLRDTAAAEDVVHDVFVKFLRLQQFRLTGSLKAYLATCVANAARNILAANSRHPAEPLEEVVDTHMDIQEIRPGPDSAAMAGEENQLINQAVAALPYDQRETVVLHIKGGLRFAEIAAAQRVSVNTVLGRYRYALEKLRSKLNGKVSLCDRMLTLSD